MGLDPWQGLERGRRDAGAERAGPSGSTGDGAAGSPPRPGNVDAALRSGCRRRSGTLPGRPELVAEADRRPGRGVVDLVRLLGEILRQEAEPKVHASVIGTPRMISVVSVY